MEKRTFRNCRFYRSGDVLFADMEVFKGQGNNRVIGQNVLIETAFSP